MGRAKVKLELIKNPKILAKSFKSRTKILTKKAHELKTLCDVDVCMIIYCRSIEGRPVISWPPNSNDEIRSQIEAYNKQTDEDRKRRSIGLVDILKDRNKKMEDDLAKLRKINNETRFPTWDERYDKCSDMELRKIVAALGEKIKEGKKRIEETKGSVAGQDYSLGNLLRTRTAPLEGPVVGQGYSLESFLRTRSMPIEVPHDQVQQMHSHDMKFPSTYYHQHQHQHQQQVEKHQLDHTNNPLGNPMLMTLLDNSQYPQPFVNYNGIYTYNSYNPHHNDLQRTIEIAGANFSQPSTLAYTPNMVTVPAYLQYPVVAGSTSSQMTAMQMEKYYDFSQNYMGNEKLTVANGWIDGFYSRDQ